MVNSISCFTVCFVIILFVINHVIYVHVCLILSCSYMLYLFLKKYENLFGNSQI